MSPPSQQIDKRIPYEQRVDERTVLRLHELCSNCTRVVRASRTLLELRNGSVYRGAVETVHFGTPNDLKSGYLSDCHLCAKLWSLANGCLLDPDDAKITVDKVSLSFEGRNPPRQNRWRALVSQMQSWWNGPTPKPFREIRGADLWISEVGHHEMSTLYGRKTSVTIYRSSDAEVNDKAPSQARCPMSSKHEMTLETIQAWHKQCMKSHQKCKQFPQLTSPIDQYPTRLLDVSSSRIRLVSGVDALKPEYTTLSHMWGPDPKLCLSLKTTNIEDFKIDIPESLLAVKYLDAIRITRALGYSYIWIDSLCIIQDSAEDWKREALKMAAVYGRTSCNISYVYPPSDTASAKHLRDPRLELPCRLDSAPQTSTSDASTSPEASPFLVVRTTSRSAQWTTNTQGVSWPLLTRAWVFQERLLCPRNIYYGAGFLLWECGEMVEDEFLGSVARGTEIGGKRVLYPIFSGAEDLAGDSQRKDTFNYQWFSLVGEYRLRNLTYETDRSIAFAGIARAIQTHTGYTYLAGIWKEFAVYGMLWHISVSWFKTEERRDFCARREATAKSAPSWSWFSVPGHWGERVIRDVVRPLFCIAAYECSSYAIYEARVTSFHHPKLQTDPTVLFHDYRGLEITLRTRRILCALEWDEAGAGTGRQVLRVLPFGSHIKGGLFMGERVQETKDAMNYQHDDIALLPGSDPPRDTFMVLLVFQGIGAERGRKNRAAETTDPLYTGMRVDWQYGGLVVVPAGKNAVGQACWRRVGVFLFSGHVDDPEDTKYPFDLHGGQDEDVVLV